MTPYFGRDLKPIADDSQAKIRRPQEERSISRSEKLDTVSSQIGGRNMEATREDQRGQNMEATREAESRGQNTEATK